MQLASDGAVTKSGIADEQILGWALHQGKAYIHHARDELSVQSLGGGEAKTIPTKPITWPLSCDDRGILLQVYDDGWLCSLYRGSPLSARAKLPLTFLRIETA